MSISPKHASFAAAQAKHVLIVDDDASILTVLSRALEKNGYRVTTASDAPQATTILTKDWVDLIVTDVTMPGGDGLSALKHWRARGYTMPVMVMSAHHLLLNAAKAAELGATQFLAKPFDLAQLISAVLHALDDGKKQSAPTEDSGIMRLAENTVLIGKSSAMQEVYRTMLGLMNNDVTAMIFGESGTGKELIARGLHLLGARKHKPFVALNMAAIPHDLVESALFGHEKGAFTGAHERRSGAFEQAEGGTLFLDEIGDMPLHAQTRLLRVLQEGTYTPIGSARHHACNVRILTATHRDLNKAIADGTFREDLFYRLHVVPVNMPPLRARAEDIPPLAEHFLEEALQKGLQKKTLDTSAMLALMRHSWPGNVRELKHLILRICATTARPVITASDIHDLLVPTMPAADKIKAKTPAPEQKKTFPAEAVQAFEHEMHRTLATLIAQMPSDQTLYDIFLPVLERPLIELALKHCEGSQVKAAKLLGMNRNTLRTKIKQLRIERKSHE